MENKITIDDVKKVEIRAGKILSAEPIEGSEKLLKLSVSMGEETPRQILSGIAKYFPDPGQLVGRTVAFVANLQPRMMMGLESQGMILAVSGQENIENGDSDFFSLLSFGDDVSAGALVK